MRYLDAIIPLLEDIRETQAEAIERAAGMLATAIANDHMVFAFGPSHAGILAQELFYRAGGLVPISPILPPGLTPNVRPITLTSRLERLPGLGRQIMAEVPIEAGDVLIAISVSGRNVTVVEIAQAARERGATVVALSGVAYSRAVGPRQANMPLLVDVADLVLDLRVPLGDALVPVADLPQRVGPASTVAGAAILNALVVRTAEMLAERGLDVPIFQSANVDGGDAHNRRWLEHYRGRLTYM